MSRRVPSIAKIDDTRRPAASGDSQGGGKTGRTGDPPGRGPSWTRQLAHLTLRPFRKFVPQTPIISRRWPNKNRPKITNTLSRTDRIGRCLDDGVRTYRTARDTARAQTNNAKDLLDAAVNTAKQNNQAIASARADVESAQTQVAEAEQNIADTIIKAPFAGI